LSPESIRTVTDDLSEVEEARIVSQFKTTDANPTSFEKLPWGVTGVKMMEEGRGLLSTINWMSSVIEEEVHFSGVTEVSKHLTISSIARALEGEE
jgi:hypothetical protein